MRKNAMCYSVERLMELLQPGRVEGNFSGTVGAIRSLETAGENDLSFLNNAKYYHFVPQSRASIILLPEDYEGRPAENQTFFFLKNPSFALAQICAEIELTFAKTFRPGIHPTAVVAESAQIAASVHIGPHCVIDGGVEIGEGSIVEANCVIGQNCVLGQHCHLFPTVTLYADSQLGDRVRIHSGAVIGCDGYGYATIDGVHQKLPQIGSVVIGDDVEIGANVTIDRARFDETRIGAGTKIDNLVQIGHNVRVGRACLLVSQCGIAGSTTLGNGVVLGGQVGVAGHLSIGDGTQIGAQSGTAKSLAPGSLVRGTPAMAIGQANRFYVLRKKLPDLFKRVEDLERARKKDR